MLSSLSLMIALHLNFPELSGILTVDPTANGGDVDLHAIYKAQPTSLNDTCAYLLMPSSSGEWDEDRRG